MISIVNRKLFIRRPIEESLREFENMRKGKYAANEATLRMKMDMLSPNPNMWDQVIRIILLLFVWVELVACGLPINFDSCS